MDEIVSTAENKGRGLIEHLKNELSGLRTNRPTPKLIEDIQAQYAENSMPIKQLGTITVVPPNELQITVWDKNAVAPIIKAIEQSSLGLNPNTNGTIIHLRMPPLTEERRMELAKIVKATTEQSRIQVRSIREDANKKVESALKTKEINEDQKFKTKEKIQTLIDGINKEIDLLLEQKTKEITE